MPKKIIVIGGGITGLAAAYRLQQQAEALHTPIELHILEAASRLGGTIKTVSRDGFLLESGPDCFLAAKPAGVELCTALGIADQLIPTRTAERRSFIVRGGKLHPVPEGVYLIAPSRLRPFLTSPLLSWRGKWRVLAESLIPSRKSRPWKKGGEGGFQKEELSSYDESLASFVRRRLGQEALDWLAQPLLAGIYAANPETLSLQATFPEFLEMEKKYGSVLVGMKQRGAATREASGARYGLFVTLKAGMQSLTERLEQALPAGSVHLSTTVTGLKKKPSGTWEVQLVKGQTMEADGVCLALPAYVAGALLFNVHPALSDFLKTFEYAGSATLQFAFNESAIRHPLNGFGFVTPHAENRPTLACTFVHKKFPGRAPAGQALLRAFVGGALQAELLEMEDLELQRRVLADLKVLLGISEAPLFSITERWPRAMPQYTVGHVHRILKLEEMLLGIRNLTLAGNWLHGVGIPDCIASGEQAADRLLEQLET